MSARRFGAISAIKIAVKTPTGTPTTTAPNVETIEATIMVATPNSAGGSQSTPRTMPETPASWNAGILSATMK